MFAECFAQFEWISWTKPESRQGLELQWREKVQTAFHMVFHMPIFFLIFTFFIFLNGAELLAQPVHSSVSMMPSLNCNITTKTTTKLGREQLSTHSTNMCGCKNRNRAEHQGKKTRKIFAQNVFSIFFSFFAQFFFPIFWGLAPRKKSRKTILGLSTKKNWCWKIPFLVSLALSQAWLQTDWSLDACTDLNHSPQVCPAYSSRWCSARLCDKGLTTNSENVQQRMNWGIVYGPVRGEIQKTTCLWTWSTGNWFWTCEGSASGHVRKLLASGFAVLAGQNLQRVPEPSQVSTPKYRSCKGWLGTTRKSK